MLEHKEYHSIDECRELISEDLTDEEIIAIRQEVYTLSELCIEIYFQKHFDSLKLSKYD